MAPADPRCGGADRGLRASAAERGLPVLRHV